EARTGIELRTSAQVPAVGCRAGGPALRSRLKLAEWLTHYSGESGVGKGSAYIMPLSPAAPPQGSGEAQRLQLLVDAISDYAIYMLDPDGAVVSWNAGAQRIQGYEAREIIGQHFSRFFTSEDRAEGLPARILQKARRAGRSETEAWRLRKDGSRYLATSLVQPVRDEGGRMLGFAEIT